MRCNVRVPAGQAARAAAAGLLLASLTLGAGLVLAQEADQAFKDAVEARKKGQWAEAVTLLRRAIQQDPNESTRRVGSRFLNRGEEYLPHFLLGDSLQKVGQCAAAVDAWATSERQGVIRKRPEYADLQRGYKECASKGVLLPAAFEELDGKALLQVTEATRMATAVDGLKAAHADIWVRVVGDAYRRAYAEIEQAGTLRQKGRRSRLAADFNESIAASERAKDLLRGAEESLAKAAERSNALTAAAEDVRRSIETAERLNMEIEPHATRLTPAQHALRLDGQQKLSAARGQLAARSLSESSVANARTLAHEGQTLLQGVKDLVDKLVADGLKQQLDRAMGQATPIFSRVENALTTIQSLLARGKGKEDIAARHEAARKQFEQIERRLRAAYKGSQIGGIQDASKRAERMLVELQQLEAQFPPLTLEDRGVTAWLQAAVTQYLRGEYANALSTLGTKTAEVAAAQLHVHLFRAAAQHALYVRSDGKDTGRREAALAEIARCRALSPTFTPDATVFSPKFIELFQGVPTPVASAATP